MSERSQPVAIITGAEQGIGAGLVAAFRRAGYAVVASSLSIPASDEPDLLTVRGDITDVDTARRVVEQALDRFGRIDSLINNAGVYIGKPFTDYTLEDYAAITAVNLAGFFHITQRAIRQMVTQGAGHVVNISTSLVEHADSKRPSALASLTKGGLAAVTRSLAIEYASRGVRVNAVSLGVIRTPMHDPASYDGHGRASPARSPGRGQRRRRRDPVSRARHFRHRRDPAHRRRSGRWALTDRHLGPPSPPHRKSTSAGPWHPGGPSSEKLRSGINCRAHVPSSASSATNPSSSGRGRLTTP